MRTLLASLLFLAASASGQDEVGELDSQFAGSSFKFQCPEPNGLFADAEQCDLFYTCVDGISYPELCEDGLLFDDSRRNHERCKLPHGVECGKREFVQEPSKDLDTECVRANGIFDHPDADICNKFFLCDKGRAHEMPCTATLIFDVTIGACVREENLSPEGKICRGENEPKLKTIEGFTCPGKETLGPTGLLQAHPVFPHPSDCQFFFTCFFGREPNKFGCIKGQVFDAVSLTCKTPEEVPECGCWYDCGRDSDCPDTCNADCTCPAAELE